MVITAAPPPPSPSPSQKNHSGPYSPIFSQILGIIIIIYFPFLIMINNVLQRKVPWKSVDVILMYLLEFIWENKLQINIREKSEYYVIFRFLFVAS